MMDITHRKINKVLKITDGNNNPIAGEKIHVKLTNHDFLFGCGAFETIYYMNTPEGEEYDRLKDGIDKWLDLFNYGTLPFYWALYEKNEGETDENLLKPAAEFLLSKGVKTKGHTLCWHSVCAKWLMDYDNDAVMNKLLKRIEREMSAFKGIIDIWDVINEVVIMPDFDKEDNAITRLCKDKGRVGLTREVFDMAKSVNPDATLLINDFNTSSSYEKLIDELLSAGVPVSAIGIQSHQHQGFWGREKLEEVLERYSRFNLPIHFTENTLVSGSLIPEYIVDLNDWQVEEWPSTPEGEERQKKEMEEMYRILFAHPLVEAVTNWDFRDGAWLKAPSGIVRIDGSAKPAYYMLKDLIHGEWSTDLTIESDENGFVKFEGFKGEYEIECSGLTKKASFLNNDEEQIKFEIGR